MKHSVYHKINYIIYVMLCIGIITSCASSPKKISNQKLEEATYKYANKQYTFALKLLGESIARYKHNAPALHLRGKTFYALGDYEKAIIDISKAIKIDETSYLYYYDRAMVYKAKGSFRKAIRDLKNASNLNRNHAESFYQRGIIHGSIGENEEALQNYSQAIQLRYTKADLYYRNGRILFSSGEYAKAEANFTIALRSYYAHPDVYFYRGIAKIEQGKTESSRQDFEKNIAMTSEKNDDSYYYIGLSYLIDNNNAEAIRNFTRALAKNPRHIQSYLNRGNAYRNIGDEKNAEADFKKAQKYTIR